MDNQLLSILANYQAKPCIIDRVSDNLIFFGFCLPTTISESHPSWLIQIYCKDANGIERTGFANGVRKFDQRWDRRDVLTYRIGELMPEIEYQGKKSYNDNNNTQFNPHEK